MIGRGIDALAGALARLAVRERRLVALGAAVLALAGVVAGLVLPALDRREAARAGLAEAAALHGWLALRIAEAEALPPLPGDTAEAPDAGPDRPPPAGLAGVEASLVAAGLREAAAQISAEDSTGTVVLRFDAVAFTALMPWIDRVGPETGYRLAGLRLARTGSPGAVQAELRLAP